jgi:hypothetical protein
LCTSQYCSRYLVGSRGKGEISTGTNHLGFRCVRDAKPLGLQSAAAAVADEQASTHQPEDNRRK